MLKTTTFVLDNPALLSGQGEWRQGYVSFYIPTLPAYAVTQHVISGWPGGMDGGHLQLESTIENDRVIVYADGFFYKNLVKMPPILMVHYLGISNYSLLFPHVKRATHRNRLANYMEEADKAFEQGAWLSSVLMAGAVLEGQLSELSGDDKSNFGNLIKRYEKAGVFEGHELAALRVANEARNLVHLGRQTKKYVTREDAMTVRRYLEQFLRKDWKLLRQKYRRIS